mgnify:CR=1 FL=1
MQRRSRTLTRIERLIGTHEHVQQLWQAQLRALQEAAKAEAHYLRRQNKQPDVCTMHDGVYAHYLYVYQILFRRWSLPSPPLAFAT